SQIEEVVDRKPVYPAGPYVLNLFDIGVQDRIQAGEKMAHLGEVSRLAGMYVPPGFVVTATATRSFLNEELLTEINRKLQVKDSDDLASLYHTCEAIQNLVRQTPLPADLEELLQVYYARLEQDTRPGCRVALRSSALGEDVAGVSFAGLYRTVLDVDRSSLVSAYKEVIASKYGARAIAYRRKRGYRHEDIEMCVGCLAMVDALISGVLYTRDPSDQEADVVRINAAAGIARGVVDGTTAVDLFLVGRDKPYPLVYSEINRERQISAESGAAAPSLTYQQLRKLVESALRLEEHFGCPQDIEWSFDHQGRLYILQSRPMKTAEPVTEQPLIQVDQDVPPLLFGGVCAASGIGAGIVHRVDSPEDMQRFPKDGVLVLDYPLPDWAPLVGRAVAVIAQKGSEAGHLATVSREFGIPALFGVADAMQVLADGQEVTVNAGARAVYRGIREDILKMRTVRRELMAGSPVQRLLSEALQYITPLNLNDPASTKFKASWCETLHDITRFCHEKSVTEMFNAGQLNGFDKASAKRLVGDVPLEWWVIDLADGFREGVPENSPTVRIDDIASLPMLAIWQGIEAVPWGGPPPVSARGFGSIILQSTMRPELDPSVPSALTVKNYFLISRHFCNLSVRLGYHYAMIEAFLSDMLTESYVTFRFKGGAADMRRKALRARLLSEVLKHYGFRIELQSDALLARIKKKETPYLESRLKILGYLTVHARQIDMAMDRETAVKHYREKFLQDIESMLAAPPTPPVTTEEDHGNEVESDVG
ncbi:MAG: PEP/pyruvate-binding domain-containing protein, partial [Desulfofustis sp.]|nr:PEP/pyruvate-binding domain-containing protein [Desulfofustis sp.]